MATFPHFHERADDAHEQDFDSIDDHITILETTPEISDAIEKGADLRQFAAKVSSQLYDETLCTMEEYVENASQYASLWKTLKEAEGMFDCLHKTLTAYNADLSSTAISMRALTETTIEKDTQIENRRNAVEQLSKLLPLIRIPPNLLATLSSSSSPMPAFVGAVRRTMAISNALNNPALFPPNSALKQDILPEIAPAAAKAASRLCDIISAYLARLTEGNTNVRIHLSTLSRRFAFAPAFIAQFGASDSLASLHAGHMAVMGVVVATRLRNAWRAVRDQGLLGGVADEPVVPKGTFDPRTGQNGKLPRARPGVPSIDDARQAVRSLTQQDEVLLVDPVFISAHMRGSVSYVDALGRVLTLLASDVRTEVVFLRSLFGRTDAQLEGDVDVLLHTHRGGGLTSAMPNMLHGMLHLSSSASGVVTAVMQGAVKDKVAACTPLAVLMLRVIGVVQGYCEELWTVPRVGDDDEKAAAAGTTGRKVSRPPTAADDDDGTQPLDASRCETVACPAPFKRMLASLADQLWTPYREAMGQHIASIRDAVPVVSSAAAAATVTMDSMTPSQVAPHVVVERYAVLVADLQKANAPARAVGGASSAVLHSDAQTQAAPAAAPVLIAEAAAAAAREALGVGEADNAVDIDGTEVWSQQVMHDLEDVRLEMLQLIVALANRCSADPRVRSLYLVNAYSAIEDALVSRTVPPTNGDRRVYGDLLAQQSAAVHALLTSRCSMAGTLSTLASITDELLASFTPRAHDANLAMLPPGLAERIPDLAVDFAGKWLSVMETSASFLAQFVPSRSASRYILCSVLTTILDRNARLWAVARACWSSPPFLPRLVSNQRITADIRNKYGSSLS